jgi:hypothetical protein
MTSILENELIQKYFKTCCWKNEQGIGLGHSGLCDKGAIALAVLCAMTELIAKGEEYLCWTEGMTSGWTQISAKPNEIFPLFHPWQLRLPSRFQPQAEEKKKQDTYCNCGTCPKHPTSAPQNYHPEGLDMEALARLKSQEPKRDAVEEKIQNILKLPIHERTVGWYQGIEEELRALVRIARGEEK